MFLIFVAIIFSFAEINHAENRFYVAADVGKELQMQCKLNDQNDKSTIRWYKGVTPISKGSVMFESVKLFNFSISNGTVPGQTLSVKSVRLEHADIYKCLIGLTGMQAFTDVSVFDSKPLCLVTNRTKPASTVLHCSLNHSAKLLTTITWSHKGRTLAEVTSDNGATVPSKLEIVANNSTPYSGYRCTVNLYAAGEQSSYSNLPTNITCALGEMLSDESDSNNYKSNFRSNAILWIVVGCATTAFVIAVAISFVMYAKKHPEVCKKSFGPDIVQQAGIAQNGEDLNGVFRRVDVHPEVELVAVPEPDEPNDEPEMGRVYAEVLIQQRELPMPPHMHDSPAWNYAQASPAISHCSRNVISSRGATPRNGSPIIGLDGTQYLDINSVATIPVPSGTGKMPRRPPARLPTDKYHPAVYAPIDHTARPPPPPPPNDE